MKRLLQSRRARAGLLLLGMLLLLAVFADLLVSRAPLVAGTGSALELLPAEDTGFEWAIRAPLDGSSVLGRTLLGTRGVVLVSACVMLLALVSGLAGGALAGFGPRVADALLARAVELTSALPTLVLIAIVDNVEPLPRALSLVLVIALVRAVRIARLVRGQILCLSQEQFVLAARASGASSARIVSRHLGPHLLGVALVEAAFTAAAVVSLEAALSFVGLGLPSELAGWGSLIGELAASRESQSALALPLGAIALTTAALWLVADAADDALTGRQRGVFRGSRSE
jgi:ABC-type dipeptide/oligopeptide/nickel transport system permease subunit